MSGGIVPLGRITTAEAFAAHLDRLGLALPFDASVDTGGPLAEPLTVEGHTIGNRFAVLPMEGWDGTADGRPTALVERRWQRFGASGAKLVWGCEAVAVRDDGRANPHQLVINERTAPELAATRRALVEEHERHHGTSEDLLVGLQLTHSGRWSRPDGTQRPIIAYHHPLLDRRISGDALAPITDDALDELRAAFVRAAVLARDAGFGFVDVKHCHGYLLHELLSAHGRTGAYGGSFDARTRFTRRVIEDIRAAAPDLLIGVRLSAFDFAPFRAGADGISVCEVEAGATYPHAFGGDGTGRGIDLAETHRFVELLSSLGVRLLCVTAGSPYYNPHIQRPAFAPPSDGYAPPEDPLAGVVRQLDATAEIKRRHPEMIVVGSGYSYLQQWLPHVAQRRVADGLVDAVGLGRSMLSYPELAADALAGRPMDRRRLCRTFSDCTTAPRSGMVSGCYPLDPFYKSRPEHARLTEMKRAERT